MSGKSYVGVNNIARENKKIYVGVNNIAREVKKAYVGVNGIAREIYSGGDLLKIRVTFNPDLYCSATSKDSHPKIYYNNTVTLNKTSYDIIYDITTGYLHYDSGSIYSTFNYNISGKTGIARSGIMGSFYNSSSKTRYSVEIIDFGSLANKKFTLKLPFYVTPELKFWNDYWYSGNAYAIFTITIKNTTSASINVNASSIMYPDTSENITGYSDSFDTSTNTIYHRFAVDIVNPKMTIN